MMGQEFARVLARYGQNVRVYTPSEPEGKALRAFIQPMRERGTDPSVPSPLGEVKQDRFLYFGPPEPVLDEDSRVEMGGECFRVRAAQPVYVGQGLSHWWAVLSHRAQEVVR